MSQGDYQNLSLEDCSLLLKPYYTDMCVRLLIAGKSLSFFLYSEVFSD